MSREVHNAAFVAAGGVLEPAAARRRAALEAPDRLALPRYALVGARPAVATWAADGGLEALALDWGSGELARDMSVLLHAMGASTSPDVTPLTAAEFEAHLARLLA